MDIDELSMNFVVSDAVLVDLLSINFETGVEPEPPIVVVDQLAMGFDVSDEVFTDLLPLDFMVHGVYPLHMNFAIGKGMN